LSDTGNGERLGDWDCAKACDTLHCTTDVAQDVFLSVEEVSTGDLDTAIELATTQKDQKSKYLVIYEVTE